MSFLAPWAFAIAAVAAAGVVLLHLVARSRPAAYFLPTTRFIPDRRTLVSRAATRPRDLLLLVLRVLLLLSAGAAFARPVLTPTRGAVARVLLLDRSSDVADMKDAVARARNIASDGVPTTVIAFDTTAHVLASPSWDSLAIAPPSRTPGSLSAALVAARRASVALAERSDSVQLVVVSPIAARETDAATQRIRAEWPGAMRLERVAQRADSSTPWRVERALSTEDPLGPAMIAQRGVSAGKLTRLVRTPMTAADSVFVRAGGTVVQWDSASAVRPRAEGLALGDEVVVASLGRSSVPADGRTIARWSDGSAAAVEQRLGDGCVREVGVRIPSGGDIALHPGFQRIVRALLTPCGVSTQGQAARTDSADVARLVGSSRSAAPAHALRSDTDRYSPLARWLLALALLLAIVELAVRARSTPEVA